MFETITRFASYLENVSFFTYPISVLLGFLAGVTAISCCLPIVPAIAGFVVGQGDTRKRFFLVPLYMMFGTIFILGVLGIVVSLAGLSLQNALGKYWFYLIGTICIVIGLFVLGVVKLPAKIQIPKIKQKGFLGPFIFGICIGGLLGLGSTCCMPILPVVLTYAAIKGRPVHGAMILGTYAIGQSIPLFAIGLFSNLLNKFTGKWLIVVRWAVGILLIVAGLYFIL